MYTKPKQMNKIIKERNVLNIYNRKRNLCCLGAVNPCAKISGRSFLIRTLRAKVYLQDFS